jgi:glycogen operon protein
VSYNEKHNQANGEENTDGLDLNDSWNCGAEGRTDTPAVLSLRRRQSRNFMALLLLAQGVPMILGGDEFLRSQGGNNNAYCQDNATSWLSWGLREENADFFRFVSRLIRFRRAQPTLRRRLFFEDQPGGLGVAWHGPKGGPPDPLPASRSLGMHLLGGPGHDDLYLLAHAHWEPESFVLPKPRSGRHWWRFLDTSLTPPADVAEPGEETRLPNQGSYPLRPRSVVVLVGR